MRDILDSRNIANVIWSVSLSLSASHSHHSLLFLHPLICRAFGTLEIECPRLLDMVAKMVLSPAILRDFNAQDLSNTIWALARLRYENEAVMFAMVSVLASSVRRLALFPYAGLSVLFFGHCPVASVPLTCDVAKSRFVRCSSVSHCRRTRASPRSRASCPTTCP